MKTLLENDKIKDFDEVLAFLGSLNEEEQRVFKGFVDGFELCRQIRKKEITQ